jgi:hypothetical protein
MTKLLSGSTLRSGGSNTFINLSGAQPQLPESPSTGTGFTLVTDNLLQTTYRSSLGNLEMNSGTIFNNIPNGNITLAGTGTGFVYVSSSTASTSTTTGALVVNGGIGVGGGIWANEDIHVNGLQIGRGFEGVNNIVITGSADPQINEFSNGQESVAIGYDALLGLSTAYKSIAIGRNALSTGTEIRNSIAIGDGALKETGSVASLPIGSITDISATNPIVVTVVGHGTTTGTHVVITGVSGMTEINDLTCYVKAITPDTLELYSNLIVTSPIDGTGFTAYSGDGTLSRLLDRDNNIAIGTNAGNKLIDGKQNFFFGDGIAANLTTGSYNFFIGHEVGQNLTHGNGIIAIGGDNIVDGVDDQVNIGSVFYYNGLGNLELMADVEVGLGTPCGTSTAALWVIGGAHISDNVCVESTETSTSTTTGAIVVTGGVGIGKDVFIGQDLTVLGIINGSINTATNLFGGARGSVPFQTSTGITSLLPIGTSGTFLVSDGDVPFWGDLGSIGLGGASTATESIFVNAVIPETTYYLGLSEVINDYSPFDGDSALTYVTTTATTSTFYSSGTSILNVPGSIYSNDGNVNEGNLLYSPSVIVSATAPTNPKVGDFWIDTVNGVELQWIQDGSDRFWIQFTGL